MRAALLGLGILIGGALLIHWGLYGLALFTVIPTATGGIGALVSNPRSAPSAAGLGVIANLAVLLVLFTAAREGLFCIAMAVPIVLPLGAIGGVVAYLARNASPRPAATSMLALIPLGTVGFDMTARPPVFEVRSAIEIAAPPERVWKNVVTFSDLAEPDQWFFQKGLAYPKRARIEGAGPGAVRYCEFSTGPFVEPIEVWDEPRLLQFRVTENPPPMHEWSPYANVVPNHLHGYFESKKGQFKLIPLSGNKTLLEGTTWYQHGLWPARYWRFWSDAIIHRIHMRVLTHIRDLSEP